MTNFRAVTFSGAVYEYREGILRIQSKRIHLPTVFKPWSMKSSENPHVFPWDPEAAEVWRDTSLPVVGERFYAAGKDEWRISTEVVSVEELEEETDSAD